MEHGACSASCGRSTDRTDATPFKAFRTVPWAVSLVQPVRLRPPRVDMCCRPLAQFWLQGDDDHSALDVCQRPKLEQVFARPPPGGRRRQGPANVRENGTHRQTFFTARLTQASAPESVRLCREPAHEEDRECRAARSRAGISPVPPR
jgi:hypothetical protein